MKNLVLCLGLLLSVISVSAQQVPKSLTASNGQFIGFYQYTPTNYNSSTKYPVIIFLHGIGERGNGTTDLTNLLGLGVPGAINGGHNMTFTWNGKTETFLVLSPQLDTKYGSWQNFYVDEMINYAKKNLSIDENRIFLTGLSLGGGGVWSYAGASLDNAKKFAAIGVSCGTCQSLNWCNFSSANLPVWAFHATDDGTVGVGCTTGAIANINKCNPAVKPYMTIWPDGNHWIWGRVFSTDYSYQNPNLYEWFLGQDKSKAVNKRPVADGANASALSAVGLVTLDASKSTDEDGKIVRYIWRKISGPSYGTITASVTVNSTTTVTGLNAAGTYQYELKVVDDRADWSLDTVTVTVGLGGTANKAPTATAGAAQTITLPISTVTLTGTGTDSDGSIASYSWSKSSGPSAGTIVSSSSASTNVTGLVEGTYVFKLTVTDNSGASGSAEVTITVKPVVVSKPTGPTSEAGDDVSITLPVSTVALDGSGSVEPYGSTFKAYKWWKKSGPSAGTITNATALTTTVTGLTEGTYVFTLTVWDSKWMPYDDIKTIVVNKAIATNPDNNNGGSGGGGTDEPVTTNVANAGADFAITLPTSTGTLNGSASTDPKGVIKAYKWAQISGPNTGTIASSTAATTAVSGLIAGTYYFKLTAWDNAWVPYSDTVKVTVNPAASTGGSTGRVANAGADFSISLPTTTATLNGSASTDPKGAIKAYTWNQISGPNSGKIASTTSATTTVSGLVQGTYAFRLTVWDNAWVPGSDTVILVVKPGSSSSNSSGDDGSPAAGSVSNAGPDITIYTPDNSITLDGSRSADANGGVIKAWSWTKIAGPEQHNIANASVSTTTVTNLVEGTYQFKLMVWDNAWMPYADTVTVYVVSQSAISRSATVTTEAARSTTTTANATAYSEQVLLYPNPVATTTLNVQTTSSNTGASVVNVYDMSGKLVQKTAFQKGGVQHQQSLNVSNLAPGVYSLEVVIGNAKRFNSKFVKQ